MTVQEKRDLIDVCYASPLTALSDCLRGFLISRAGHALVSADWANIEGRGLAWLAGEEWVLAAFRDFDRAAGPDIYKLSAQRIFGCPLSEIKDDKRQIGKVAELALGYQGGKLAFQSMAKGYGVKISDERAEEIKTAWREARPATVSYWNDLNRVAIAAVNDPGKVYFAGPEGRQVKYKKSGSFLFCLLPSGRALSYPYPVIEEIETPWGEKRPALKYMGLTNNQWVRQTAYGGLLCENITQAVSRDILAEALKRLDARGFDIVMHCHDEIVCEVKDGTVATEEFEKIMCETPLWARGLPIVAKGWQKKRYKK